MTSRLTFVDQTTNLSLQNTSSGDEFIPNYLANAQPSSGNSRSHEQLTEIIDNTVQLRLHQVGLLKKHIFECQIVQPSTSGYGSQQPSPAHRQPCSSPYGAYARPAPHSSSVSPLVSVRPS